MLRKKRFFSSAPTSVELGYLAPEKKHSPKIEFDVRQIQRHFPHLQSMIEEDKKHELDWALEFQDECEIEYGLDKEQNLFYLVKASDLEAIKHYRSPDGQGITRKNFAALIWQRDRHNKTLVDCLHEINNQEILDYFYLMALRKSVHLFDQIIYAIIFKQKNDCLKKLLARFSSTELHAFLHSNINKDTDMKPIHLAIRFGNLDAVKLFIFYEFSLTSQQSSVGTPAVLAAKCGQAEIFNYLLDENNESRLVLAASAGDFAGVKKIIANDPEALDRDGANALKRAVQYGRIEVVEYFLDTLEMGITLPEGCSLHDLRLIATEHQQIETLRILAKLEKNDREFDAILNSSSPLPLSTDDDFTTDEENNARPLPQITPLGLAAKLGHYETVKYLINEEQVDINERDANGRTALEIAANCGNNSVAQLLLVQCNLEFEPGSINLSKLSVRNRNRIKLIEYIPKRQARADHYTSYGKRFRCDKATKIKAARALMQYALFGYSPNLEAHRKALTECNSELGKIYKVLKN